MTVPADPDPAAAEAGPRLGGVTAAGRCHRPGAPPEPVAWLLPEEAPVALVYNRRSFAVMLASPADLEDFALGFSLSEGVVAALDEIDDLVVRRLDQGLGVEMTIPAARAAALLGRRRGVEGSSACGLCGIDDLAAVQRPLPAVVAPAVTAEAIRRAGAGFAAHQPLRARTHSVHGAAWCDPAGTILLAREDVGRHNALDKLIGAARRQGLRLEDGFALLSSRCGVELVRKAARVGIGLLATLSAPTGLAATMAAAAGLDLAVLGRDGGVTRFGRRGEGC
ncbi:formate dehydrogenase accessory sulfurtransferase FdhD [Phaeospirillum tilakii]|uniref:Sulfur carrier protein FdhD n=1 Tax=Phaeospirillum tilakii TaxID=741673 RepID=A0ABW5C827_9PROT